MFQVTLYFPSYLLLRYNVVNVTAAVYLGEILSTNGVEETSDTCYSLFYGFFFILFLCYFWVVSTHCLLWLEPGLSVPCVKISTNYFFLSWFLENIILKLFLKITHVKTKDNSGFGNFSKQFCFNFSLQVQDCRAKYQKIYFEA